ncbi:MAG: LamG-like jellyroll fold domain-containing protein, partial [Bacteroidota bacterium]
MMKPLKPFLLVGLVINFFTLFAQAGTGDTTVVQTFTFNSVQDKKFKFPGADHRWEKILMYYTLKCNPKQSPACGEWDYLTYTYFWRHTGQFDSTKYSHSNFTWNGTTPDTLQFMDSPSFSYKPWFEFGNLTPPLTAAAIGTGPSFTSIPFAGSAKDSRTQILWRKSELLAAGLHTGQITGLRFKFQTGGDILKKLTLRIKSYSQDTLVPGKFTEGSFTLLFKKDQLIPSSGWLTLPFTFPFNWDGNTNILFDISYEDKIGNTNSQVYADLTGFPSVMNAAKPDFNLSFHDQDFIKVPVSAFSSIDSAITVSFWIYGDPLLQPQNNTLFEGVDKSGQRVINLHLPWSDGKVYWDCGKDSVGYDRLSHPVSDQSLYKGKWNHWAFVKNASTARMKIYVNGQLARIGTGKHKSMKDISMFRIGSNAAGSDNFYDGMIEDFCIWNKELSDTLIRNYMYRDVDPAHPDFSHLVLNYKFNEGAGFLTGDSTPAHSDGVLRGYPDWVDYHGKERFRNGNASFTRPMVIFEQGVYNPAALDSVLKIDTLTKPPMMIVLFGDTVHPYMATDTLTKWPAYYDHYVFDPQGHPVDSTFVQNDGVLYKKDHSYYGKPFELLERFELARYITPYGNNLSLGNGWTWLYDLTDYAPLLHDSVHLSAGNWQELLDMKFVMIEGIPSRDVLGVTNIYTGNHGYANESQHNLPPVKAFIGNNVKDARLKMRITGHGFGGTDNCSEFCPRTNTLKINGTQAYTHDVWRLCGINPLYPQGGTWLYDRANWCPGAEVSTKDFELAQ